MKHLNEKAMLCKLLVTTWSGLKKDKSVNNVVSREFNTSDDAGYYSKRLVQKDLITKIRSKGEMARKILYKYSLPWQDDGARLLPAKNFIKCRDEIEKIESDRNLMIIEFCEKFEELKLDAQTRLGDLYCEADYPDDIVGKFTFELSFLPVPNVQDFRVDVNDEEMEMIKESAENAVKDVVDKSVKDVYRRAQEIVGKVADVLGKHEAKFHASLITNVAEFVSLLPGLNITDNPVLTRLYVDLKEKISTLDAQVMRDNPFERRKAAQAADAILQDLKGAYC